MGHSWAIQIGPGVTEILMTMDPILDEGVLSLSFRLEGIEQVIPYEYIRELLCFQKGAPEQVDVHEGILDGFWSMIVGGAHQQRNSIPNPIIQVFHSWMCKRILGRMRETKVTDTEVNWLYMVLIVRQPIDPTHLMINRWCCEATLGSGDIGSRCYLSMLAISLRPGITRNLEHLLPRTSLGFEYMKQGKYISGDERGGFKEVNLPLPDARLRLFIEGKENWLEEELLEPTKKNKGGRIIEEDSSAAQEGGAQKIMCHHLEEFWHHQVTTVVYQCKHGGVVQPCPHQNLRCPT
jgi:hypothetical protein